MNDSKHQNENLESLGGSETNFFDLGSFDGFDPFAEAEEPHAAPTTPELSLVTEAQETGRSEKETEPAALPTLGETTVPKSAPQKTMSAKQAEAERKVSQPTANPLQQAIAQAEDKDARKAAASLFSQPPIFTHGGVNEEITDKKMTFEQLREEKARDFSELEEASKVSWTVNYGKISRVISKPKTDVIYTIKQEIEASKEFLDALKKNGEKDLECKVKPRVTAQKKGIASYKGVFASLEEAEQAQKPISYLPARDGKVYEIRRSELGTFIAPADNVPELSQVRAGFTPALPPIPLSLFYEIIAFFRSFMRDELELEALVHVYWDKEEGEYRIAVPTQWVEKASVDAVISLDEVLDDERYLHFADIHSHNTMEAKFSPIDDQDEKATRIYLVLGRLDRYFPQVEARISCNGRFVSIPAEQVISPLPPYFPSHWSKSVQFGRWQKAVA